MPFCHNCICEASILSMYALAAALPAPMGNRLVTTNCNGTIRSWFRSNTAPRMIASASTAALGRPSVSSPQVAPPIRILEDSFSRQDPILVAVLLEPLAGWVLFPQHTAASNPAMGCDVFLHPSQRHHRSHPRTFYDAAVWDWGIGLHRIREEEKNPEVKQRRTLWNTLIALY